MTENKYKGEVFSFFKLLEKNKIEIPIIQRDYAQGRKDKKDIRNNFLIALYDSLNENKPIILDFIYGSNSDNSFQPLDGQQRLTTLFLLHWYAANKDIISENEYNKLSKFSYETRIASRDFCSALVSHKIEIEQEITISEKIIDSPWFYLSWKNDPTIDAMLRTIDDIHNKFFNTQNLWEKLIDKKQGLIQFYHVELENIGLTDDLYIKMNARGKLLTSFENFKAEFQKSIKKNDWEQGLTFENTFACKIDTVWTDFFWHNFKKNNQIDEAFIRLISTIAMIRQASNKQEDRVSTITKLQEDSNNVKPKLFLKDDFKYLVDCFDLYNKSYETIDSYKLNFSFWHHTPEKNFLNQVVFEDGGASYTQKVLFFAQTEYFRTVEDFDLEKYQEWMRVVRNIISRGDVEKNGKRPDIVRSPQAFDRVINLISELSGYCSDIYSHLPSSPNFKSTFAKEQVEEEKLKAKLIKDDNSRKELIYNIEDTDLLRGRINFALYCIDFDDKSNDLDDNLFKKIETVISRHFKTKPDKLNDLRRALLTISVDGKFEFYCYWGSSWHVIESSKRRLIDKFREIEYCIYSEYKEYFKKLILQLTDHSLQKIASRFDPPSDFPNWKKRLIKEPKLLDEKSKSNYIAIPEDNSCCYLLKSTRPRDKEGCVLIK